MKFRSSILAIATLAFATFLNAQAAGASTVCGLDGTPCSSGDLCMTGETCLQGSCVGGIPVTCPGPSDQCHSAGVCNPSTGMCSNPAVSDGTPCISGDSCPGDSCQAGACIPNTCSSTTTLLDASTTTTMQSTGACCYGDGQCIETDPNFCQGEYQGTYSGDGTLCSSGVCSLPPTTTTLPPPPTTTTLPPPLTGACCFDWDPGRCDDNVSESVCVFVRAGTFAGVGTACETGICAPPPTTTTLPPPPTGACCYGGGCQETTANFCEVGYAGDGTTCKDPGVCVNCGNGCLDFGEQCDDGDTGNDDGCNADCQEEPCFDCQTVQPSGFNGFCSGPSTCQAVSAPECSHCGNEEVEAGEDCDDGNTANGDCCSANCKFDVAGASCSDGVFCNGDETCNGEGTCLFSEVGRNCSGLSSQCGIGYCDLEADECAVDTATLEGSSCEQDADCTVPGSGTCHDGNCVGAGTTLAASCRWIILGATPGGTVKVRAGEFSTVDANTCGDTVRTGGISTANVVAAASMGQGMRFDASADIAGDIVTGGSSLGVSLYAKIPGTALDSLGSGLTAPKTPSGMADTTGVHSLVPICWEDQDSLHEAANQLNAKVKTADKGLYRLKQNSSDTIDITATPGVSVIDFATLRVGHNSTLTLKGNPTDVLMLRVNSGRLNISTGAHIVLDGLQPQNVLFYVKAATCRLSTRVEGAGTLFCPMATKFRIGVGTKWSGSFLGGTREIRARYRAELKHIPFTGF